MKAERFLLYVAIVVGCIFASNGIASENAVISFKQAITSGFADIVPSESLTVDLEGYDVPLDATLVVLQVFNNYYYLSIEPNKTRYVFSRDSGQSTKLSKDFNGIKRLDPVSVIIGKEVSPGSLEMGTVISSESIMIRVGM